MKFKLHFIIAFMALNFNAFGQDKLLQGQVSFVTTNNIYVKFDDTSFIEVGDSLNLGGTDRACLVVKSKSSTSCVCSIVNDCEIQKGDEVVFNYIVKAEPETKQETPTELLLAATVVEETIESMYTENINGSVSVSGYSNINSQRENRTRVMTRLALNASHINNSKFSFNTYLNYRYIFEQADSTSLPQNSFFRVYNLSVRYDALPSLSVIAGRNINPKISSLGAIDGLQLEKYFGKFYIGAIGGFRPDTFDYGFNSDLLQYGGYAGVMTDAKKFYSQTTLGFVEQQNAGETDRRFAYFQHNSTIFKNLNLFSSLELDLYSKVNGVTANDIRLTNLYISARYRISRKVNLMVSYDSRKRILYYQTFQSEIDRLLDDDLARQGLRARLNIRPFKYISAGFSYARRFRSDEQNKSDNLYGYVTWTRIPSIEGRLSLSYNRNESNYLLSNIGSIRYSRDLVKNKLFADFYYRFVDYNYYSMIDTFLQHYIGTNLSYNISRNLLFSVSGEMAISEIDNNYRIYARIVQRFNSKQKNRR
ncbi:MAG: hypothetical protein WBM85_16355 [Eudoraea sp.]